jgi:hypothetical protein
MKKPDPRPSIHRPDSNKTKPVPPPATEGLTPLDQDRAGSVADEGGSSAATVEAQESTAEGARDRRP